MPSLPLSWLRPLEKRAASTAKAVLRRSAAVGLCLMAFGGVPAEAQRSWQMPQGLPPGHFIFRIYGIDKGLSNLSVWAIVQDRKGFIWAGTEDGLFRYEGSRFKRFGVEDGLPSAQVTLLLADKTAGIWAGTLRGLTFFDGNKIIAPPAGARLPAAEVKSLAQDSRGRLWVALNSGLYRGALDKGFELAPGWPGGGASAVYVDSERDEEVVAALGNRIGRLNPDGTWTMLDIGRDLGSESIGALAVDAEGRLWARSPTHLFVRDVGASAFRDESRRMPPGSLSSYLCLDSNRDVWVPTNTGLLRHRNGVWSEIKREQGLPADWARAIIEDREGSLWVASMGVYRLIGGGEWLAWTTEDGLPSNTIWCIFRASDGRLHLGTDRGLAVTTPRGWQVQKDSVERTIRSVAESADGWLWMGGSPGEVIRWNKRTGRTQILGVEAGLSGERIMCLFADRKGDVWATIGGGGLMRWTPRGDGGKFQRIDLPGGSVQERCSGIVEDKRGRLWVMGENGLAVRDEKGWHRFTTRDGLDRDYVSWAAEAEDGDLWVAYYEPLGVVRLRLEGDRLRVIRRIDKSSGLNAGKVYFLGRDSRNRLWIGLGNGVDLLGPAGITHIDTGDGLAGQDCDSNAFLAESNGNVFIGTSAGLSLFRGAGDPVRNEPPPTHILSARLGNRTIQVEESRLSVKPSENTLEVKFAGLSFINEERVRHEVRLVGLEDVWRATDVREARYAALPPGSYRFEVRARQGSGSYGEQAGISFVIRPPWWQTIFARIGFVLMAGAIVLGGFRFRIRRLHQRTRELESLVAERTHELAEANESLARLSVTDPLTGLKNRRYLYLSMPEDVAQCKRIFHDVKSGRLAPSAARPDIVFQMVDLDHFKNVNDEYGHAAGDRVLLQIRDILTRVTRGTDTVVRWGGEEFLVVARSTLRGEAGRMAERLRSAVEEHRFDIGDGRTATITCSVGFSPFPVLREDPDRVSWEEAVEIADEALYAAKRSGRDAWVGLLATGTQLPNDYLTRMRADAPALLASRVFQVETSLGDPQRVRWT